jgi:chaperonin GroEL
MGPHGKYILIKNESGVSFSKDGATVAESTNGDLGLGDIANGGAELVRKAAKKMSEEAGDGSTTVTRLTYEFSKKCISLLTSNQAIVIYDALKEFENIVLKELKKMHRKISINDLSKVATLAANNNSEVGELVQKAFSELGENGVVLVEASHDKNNSVVIKRGFCLDCGPSSEMFFHSDMKDLYSMKIVLDNPSFLLLNGSFSNINELIAILDRFATSQQPLIVIADSFSKDFMTVVSLYISRRNLRCVTIVTPGYDKKDVLEDLSIFTEGKIFFDDLSAGIMPNEFGYAHKITITPKSIVISGGRGSDENITKRVVVLKQSILESTSDFQKNKNLKRIASLSSGIANISVGNPLLNGLVENAVQAARKSLESGVVPGAGMDFLQIYDTLQNYNFKNSLCHSFLPVLQCVCKQILENADLEFGVLVAQSRDSNYHLIPNAMNRGEMVNEHDIVVPFTVSSRAIEISCATACQLIFTQHSIIHKQENITE